MELLRRLGEARGEAALAELFSEVKDRYGRPPAPLVGLFDTFRLKEHCRRLGIGRVFFAGGGDVLLFIRDYPRFGRLRLSRGEGRHVEGSRVMIVLPPEVRGGAAVLKFLLEELGEESPDSRPREPAANVRAPVRAAAPPVRVAKPQGPGGIVQRTEPGPSIPPRPPPPPPTANPRGRTK